MSVTHHNHWKQSPSRSKGIINALRTGMGIALVLLLASCGSDGEQFRVSGQFRNLNQGEFYIYSPDALISKVDTIKVDRGRFAYEIPCRREGTLVIVFPNFSEMPVFAEPGKKAKVKGDVSHLKEVEVKGTKTNETMTAFRLQIASVSPPEAVRLAAQFAKDHADSPASVYIVARYLMQGNDVDMKKAVEVLQLMRKSQPDNRDVAVLLGKAKSLQASTQGSKLPTFKATDVYGKPFTQSALTGSPLAVVFTWAAWSYDSNNMMRQLHTMQKRLGSNRLKVVGLCADGNVTECKRALERDTITWPTTCEEDMLDGKLMKTFGLTYVGENIVYEQGRIAKTGLSINELKDYLEKQATR